MASEKMNPAQLAAGRARNVISFLAIASEITHSATEIQRIRSNWLVERLGACAGFDPAVLASIVSLAFGEVAR